MKILKNIAVVSIAFVISMAAANADNAAWDSVAEKMKESFGALGTVGSSLYYIANGETKGSLHLGYADKETDRMVDENTIFHWGSITKTFTGIALMQLVEEGKVALSDPIVKYLPELRKVHNPYGSMEEVTLQMLLSHTSGFRNPSFPWSDDEDWQPFQPPQWMQIEAMLPYTKLLFKPGSEYSYSNPAFIFIARVVEEVTGEDIEIYIQKNIFSPLEMHRSYFDITPRHLLKYRSNNYWVEGGIAIEQGLDFDTGITKANGALNSPMLDMIKYSNFLLGIGNADAYEGILKRKTLESMWLPVIDAERNDTYTTQLGTSFFLLDFKDGGNHLIGHTGSQAAFLATFYIHLESNSSVIIATNSRLRGEARSKSLISETSKHVFDVLFEQ
ncbi:MAG: beta-lactamase family protein [Gammaproteobacteria bacterium]|nr:beta-lactamase family protein [Gammaproteobacteria bacterium]